MYQGDTFFHLSIPGQVGLAVLSGILAIITIWCFLKISSRFGTPVKVLLAFVTLWLFVWLSPQVYYLYYWLVFENLPMQIVVQYPPTITTVFELVTFTGPANLSAHSKGVLLWLMVFIGMRQQSTR